MSRATYNITNDKLLVWFDNRLTPEEYASAKGARFVWWPGRKCFAAKWNPEAEDFITSRGIEIAEDDTPDDVEGRVERFAARAEDAANAAESSAEYLATRANTARRQENAANAVERALSEAEHWNRRIAASIRHATHKDRPDVIARRIHTLEAEERKAKKNATLGEAAWSSNIRVRDYLLKDANGEPVRNPETGKLRVDEDALRAACAPTIRRAERWAAHVGKRLVYERALLEAAGGLAGVPGSGDAAKVIEKGGGVRVRGLADGRMQEVLRVGAKSVRVAEPLKHWAPDRLACRTAIYEIVSAAEFKAMRAAYEAGTGEYVVCAGDWQRGKDQEKEMNAVHYARYEERNAAARAAREAAAAK